MSVTLFSKFLILFFQQFYYWQIKSLKKVVNLKQRTHALRYKATISVKNILLNLNWN